MAMAFGRRVASRKSVFLNFCCHLSLCVVNQLIVKCMLVTATGDSRVTAVFAVTLLLVMSLACFPSLMVAIPLSYNHKIHYLNPHESNMVSFHGCGLVRPRP